MALLPPQHEELQIPIAAYVGTPTVPASWRVDCVDSFESSGSNECGFVWWCFVIRRTGEKRSVGRRNRHTGQEGFE